MNIEIMGIGNVAQALAGGWTEAGHSVTRGSREPESRTDLSFPVAGITGTAQGADVVVNATPGGSSKELLAQVDADAFTGKLLIDIANAVTPSFELVYPDSSLREELQKMLPYTKVVKTLNTCNTSVQANPSAIDPSGIFVSGDDADVKTEATGLLRDLGWPEDSVVDLGGISSAKGPEHYFIMWASLMRALGTPTFNIRVIH